MKESRESVPTKRQWVCIAMLLCVIMSGFFIAYPRGVGALCVPSTGCTTALAYYTVKAADNLEIVGSYFQVSAENIMNANGKIKNLSDIHEGESIYVPFTCPCINGQLGQTFDYPAGIHDTLDALSSYQYEGLTQPAWIASASGLSNYSGLIPNGTALTVPVNCSCGNATVSLKFGLFVTYVVGYGTADNLASIAAQFNLSSDLVRMYNPGVSWDNPQEYAQQIAFIPVTDQAFVMHVSCVKLGSHVTPFMDYDDGE